MARAWKWYGKGDVQRIRAMAGDGYGVRDVAAEYGVSPSAVKRMTRRYGIRFYWGGIPDPDYRLAVLVQVQRGLRDCGAIGRAIGRRREQVLRWVRELEEAGALRRDPGHGKKRLIRLVGKWDETRRRPETEAARPPRVLRPRT